MKIIKNWAEFCTQTSPLMDLDFALLDITPDTRLGFFFPDRFDELLDFCKSNPQYHVISSLKDSNIEINTAVKEADIYMLAQGDADPELMHVPKIKKETLMRLRISILCYREGFSQFAEVKDCQDI